MKFNKLQLGAIPLSPDLLSKANIGIWAFELDEGQEPRMYVDDTMLGLIGLDHQVSPEETYHAWYDHVDEGSYNLVHQAVNNMMTEHAEVQYPWHHPDGRTMIVRCGGVRNMQYTKGIRIEGTHQNVTEVVHYEEQKKILLDYFVGSFSSAYSVNLAKGTFEILHMDHEFFEMFEKYQNNLNGIKVFIKEHVHPDDRDMMTQLLDKDYIRERLKKEQSFSFVVRDIYGDIEKTLRGLIIRGENEDNIAVGFMDISEDIKKEREMAQLRDDQRAFTSHLLKSYLTAFYVDLNKLDALVIKNAFHPAQEGTHIQNCFEVLFKRVAEGSLGNDTEGFEEMLTPQNIRIQLRHNQVLTRTFHDDATENSRIVMMEAVSGSDEDHVVFGFKDITEEKRREQEQKEQLENALQEANAANQRNDIIFKISQARKWSYFINDKDEVVSAQYTDETLKALNELCKDDAMAWLDYLHPEDKERAKNIFMAAIHDHTGETPYDVTFRIKNRNDSYRWAKSSGRLIRHEDGTAELFGMSIDITQQIKEQELQKKQLEEALAQAQSANRAKTLFLNNMSHDIRTPMNAIMGYTSMAHKYIDDKDKSLEFLDKIGIAGSNLLQLINQVLDMSRIESGKIVLSESPADVIERAYEMMEIMGSSAQAKNIELSLYATNVRNRYVYADGGRMNQLILNLLGNAVKYTPEGGHIKYSAEQIECDKPGYGTYVFTIEDDGIGMSKEFISKVFEPFSREASTTVSRIQGTGLGMAIVKKLIDMMGGTINIESEQGKGTKVVVTVTFRLAEENEVYTPSSEQITKGGMLNGKHALLVEDNEMNREIATMILNEQGIVVHAAEDGDVAVEKVRQHALKGEWKYYDFILMDIQMPKMNGYEATAKIREIYKESGIHIPIIALSANAFEEDRRKSLEAGMDDHVAKPIEVDVLWQTLAKLLR